MIADGAGKVKGGKTETRNRSPVWGAMQARTGLIWAGSPAQTVGHACTGNAGCSVAAVWGLAEARLCGGVYDCRPSVDQITPLVAPLWGCGLKRRTPRHLDWHRRGVWSSNVLCVRNFYFFSPCCRPLRRGVDWNKQTTKKQQRKVWHSMTVIYKPYIERIFYFFFSVC